MNAHPSRSAALAWLLAGLPVLAHAAHGPSAAGWLTLPIMLALAVGVHGLIGRGLKALLSSVKPLATGELEVAGYERRVYGTAERAMLQVVGLVLLAGLLSWVGVSWSLGWIGVLALPALLAALTLDLLHWERVSVSANYVWFQRGLGHSVHQIAIENIREVSVSEAEVKGFTLRHGQHNRIGRLNLRMSDKRVVALPKTDALGELDAVEAAANHIRTRQLLAADRHAVKRSAERGSAAAAEAAHQPAAMDADMRRELKRLRQRAQGPELPPAVKKA